MRLTISLLTQVTLVDDCIGPAVESAVKATNNGQLILLENVRFYKEEEKNDAEFSKKVRFCTQWQQHLLIARPTAFFIQ